jgi:hypothetical protein
MPKALTHVTIQIDNVAHGIPFVVSESMERQWGLVKF